MAVVMICWGPTHEGPNPTVDGEYLESFDPDAHDGRGDATFTSDKAKAKRFPDMLGALQEWKRQSTVRPIRPDGKANRPLTSFSVSFEHTK